MANVPPPIHRPPLTWRAHEYHHFSKTTDWYWVLGFVAFLGIVISVYVANYLFAVVLIVGTFSLMLHAEKEPEYGDFELSDQGVKVHNSFFLYNSLHSFWIEEYHDDHDNLIHSRLLIKSNKFFMPLIVMYIDEVSPEDIRRYLLRHLKQEELHEPLGQKLMEYFGF